MGATADDVGARGPSPPRPSVVFGAARVDSAGSQAFTYARVRPCWTGTFEDLTVSAASGKFPSHSATPLAFLPPFLRSISSLLSVLPSAPKGGWPQAPRYLSSGFPKIAPPSVLPARVNSPPCGVRSGLVPRAFAPPTLVPTSPFDCGLAGLLLSQTARVLHLAPILGFSAFLLASGSHRRRAPRAVLAALRSFAPWCRLRPTLTCGPRRNVTAASLPIPRSPLPLPPRSWPKPEPRGFPPSPEPYSRAPLPASVSRCSLGLVDRVLHSARLARKRAGRCGFNIDERQRSFENERILGPSPRLPVCCPP